MGCGRDIRPGFVNADSKPLAGVDVVCDFSRFPWPFIDNVFDEVVAIHVIEHLPNTLRVMEELHRITAPGARTAIEVPHYKHSSAYKDPTHVRFFTEESFDYFGKDEHSYYTTARFHVASVKRTTTTTSTSESGGRFPASFPGSSGTSTTRSRSSHSRSSR